MHIPGINHLLVQATTGEVSEYGTLQERTISPKVVETIVDWVKKALYSGSGVISARLTCDESGSSERDLAGRNASRVDPRRASPSSKKTGVDVVIERDAGTAAGFLDAATRVQAGAEIASLIGNVLSRRPTSSSKSGPFLLTWRCCVPARR